MLFLSSWIDLHPLEWVQAFKALAREYPVLAHVIAWAVPAVVSLGIAGLFIKWVVNPLRRK